MIATYLIMKIALQAVLDECNRMAMMAESGSAAIALKERIASLEIAFASGSIDAATYEQEAASIMEDLKNLSAGGLQPGVLLDEL